MYQIRMMIIVLSCALTTNCGRQVVEPVDPYAYPDTICREKFMVPASKIAPGRYLKTDEVIQIVSEWQKCGAHFEVVANQNAEIARQNAPDSFSEDFSEFGAGFLTGYIFGFLTGFFAK